MARPSTAENLPPTDDAPARDPFAWDPNPTVLVSRRRRILTYPAGLVARDFTADDVTRWHDMTPDRRDDRQISWWPGVTFLGAWTTSWAYLRSAPAQGPKGPPAPGAEMVLARPFCKSYDVTDKSAEYTDQSVSPPRPRPDKVHAFLIRVFRYLRVAHAGGDDGDDPWATAPGFDGPELALLPLRDVLTRAGEAGDQAHAVTLESIRHLRPDARECVTPLGALHDYAIRERQATAIVTACKQQAQRWRLG